MSTMHVTTDSQSSSDLDVVTHFYESFARRDHASMGASYADNARFSDPVFNDLRGVQVKAMWRMLCERGGDLTMSWGDIRRDGDVVLVRWEARYTFAPTKRPVHNVVRARLTVRDGRIVEHIDSFNLWRWTAMALGARGMFLGWSPFVQTKVRGEAMKGLELFMKRKRLL